MQNTDQIIIHDVREYSAETLDAVSKLAQQEGKNYKKLTEEDFKDMIRSSNISLYVAREQETKNIIGMVTLIVCRIPYAKKASMEDLVVEETYRGRGIGTMLIQKVVAEAQARGAAYLDFTSRPRRERENAFYEKLGFKKRDTNVYRHIFDYKEV